jgi:hypothetical protein
VKELQLPGLPDLPWRGPTAAIIVSSMLIGVAALGAISISGLRPGSTVLDFWTWASVLLPFFLIAVICFMYMEYYYVPNGRNFWYVDKSGYVHKAMPGHYWLDHSHRLFELGQTTQLCFTGVMQVYGMMTIESWHFSVTFDRDLTSDDAAVFLNWWQGVCRSLDREELGAHLDRAQQHLPFTVEVIGQKSVFPTAT